MLKSQGVDLEQLLLVPAGSVRHLLVQDKDAAGGLLNTGILSTESDTLGRRRKGLGLMVGGVETMFL